jgi:hypothetical protein
MIKMKKIPLFALILAVMLSTGGSCIFPMLTAQASSGAMQMDMDDQSALDGHGMDPMAHAPLSPSHVNTCTTDCGQSNNDIVTIKKVKEALEFPSLASQGTYVSPSLVDGLDLGVLELPESPPLRDALLTVAKKE